MSATLVPMIRSRLPVQFNNRIYPTFLRTGEPGMPEFFLNMKDKLLNTMPFAKTSPKSQKADLFGSYNQSVEKIRSMGKEAEAFLRKVSEANTATPWLWCLNIKIDPIPLPAEGPPKYCPECDAQFAPVGPPKPWWCKEYISSRNTKYFPIKKLPPADAFGIELAAQPVDKIHAILSVSMDKAVLDYVKVLLDTLDQMVDAKYVGINAFADGELCRYHYYSYKDVTSELQRRVKTENTSQREAGGTRHQSTTTTERDVERVVSMTFHLHDLIEAKPFGFDDPRAPKVPERVRPVKISAPEHLKPFLTIIGGNLIREATAEVELVRVRSSETDKRESDWFVPDPPPPQPVARWEPDPCIALGHFALVGWKSNEP